MNKITKFINLQTGKMLELVPSENPKYSCEECFFYKDHPEYECPHIEHHKTQDCMTGIDAVYVWKKVKQIKGI